jgi:hypothetical protein
VPFSAEAGSAMYAQALEVYQTGRTLTEEQRAIALYWADNPVQTGTPAGHWISIMNEVIDARSLRLDAAAEMYARVGIGQNDAFISCWNEKYRSCLLRPVTYVRRHIDAGWTPLISTPPFPEYTSGHSTQSAAAAAILTDLFGTFAFTDDYHTINGLVTRSFASFQAAADEAAISRLYGGIHYRMGIEVGVTQGQCVGQKVLERVQTRR